MPGDLVADLSSIFSFGFLSNFIYGDFQMKKYLPVVLAVAAAAIAGPAMADLPASVATTTTAIGADGKSMFDAVFPIVGTIIGLVVTVKLFKRFVSKI